MSLEHDARSLGQNASPIGAPALRAIRTAESARRLLTTAMLAALAALTTIAGTWTRAAAQTGTKTPSDTGATTLGVVVVTATRSATTLTRMPLHTTVISQASIEQSPAQTLDQILRQVSGMNMTGAPFYTTDPTGQQTRMRGVTNSKVLVLIDGIPVLDPFYSTTQWFKVPPSEVQRVEVVRGGNSSLWGSLAVAGVINIITKKPIDDSGEIGVSYQSLNTSDVSLSKSWVADNGFAIRISGDLLNTDGYQTTPSAYVGSFPGKASSSATNGNIRAAAYYSTPDVLTFLRVGYHRQNEDIGGYRYGTNLQKSPDAAAGFTRILGEKTHVDVRAWAQSVGFDKYNGAGCYLASETTCNASATTSPLVQYANSHDYNPYHELGGSAVYSTVDLTPALTGLQVGVDYRLVGGKDYSTTYNKPTDTDHASATVNRTNFGQGTQQFVGAFVQLTATPARGLDATVSARYDYWTNTSGVAEMTKYSDGEPGSTLGGSIPNSTKSTFDPSLSLRYTVTGAFAVRGAVYRSFRAPGLNNLYRSYSSTSSITIANPLLKPETLTGGELGADLHAGPVALGVTAFQYDTKDLIASYKIRDAASAPAAVTDICGPTLSNCPANVNFNTNGQDARSRGVELTGDWQIAAPVSVDAAYTYTNSHYTSTTTGDPTGVQLGAVPTHLVTLGTNWQATSRWSAYAGVRYTAAMYLDVNRTIRQPAFTLLDLSASYRVTQQLQLYGAVANLTNVHYCDNATTSAASQTLGLPRTLTGGVRVKF